MLDAIAAIEARGVRALAGMDLGFVVELRNDCVHNAKVPDSHDVEYVVAALRTYLGYFGVTVTQRAAPALPRTVADFSELIQSSFSSVEIIEGTIAFYRRLTEIVSNPEVDTYDLTFLVENPPKPGGPRGKVGNDPTKEYFDVIRARVTSGEARLRRIITFNKPEKAAWILFNMIGAQNKAFDDNLILAAFDATRSGGASDIMLPNVAMYYRSHDVTDGIAWIYSHQEDDNQNFIGLSGKAVFPTMRRLYMNWFKSCDRLTEARAVVQFRRFFGDVHGEDAVRAIATRYRPSILLDDVLLDRSVAYWTGLLERHAS